MKIPRHVVDALTAEARRAGPRECCGILLGNSDRIVALFPTANIAESEKRFLIDPKGHIDARRLARTRGLDVIGFYHSHPASSSEPSSTDLAEASYEGLLYVIIGMAGRPVVSAYRLERGQFTSVELQPQCGETATDT